MSKQQKPVRQDYIAKVRYINNLPPPPLNPKFLKYNVTNPVTPKEENEHLMSSLFRKENFNQFIAHIDDDYGMSLNPIHTRGFLDGGNERVFFANNEVPLHAKDRVLLRDAGIGKINKSEPGVSFLRRTEYISERSVSSRGDDKAEPLAKDEDRADPDAQLQAVEQTFDAAQQSLTNFAAMTHPRRKHLRAVAAFPLLPDTAMMDTKLLTVKFTGSASMNRELQNAKRSQKDQYDDDFHRRALSCAIYRPITSEDGEWVSFYQLKDKSRVAELSEKLASTAREQPANLLDDEDDASEPFRFHHFKNYDMHFHRFSKPYEELALKFVPDEANPQKRRAAYYSPISGRVELKKHRAATNTEINRFLDNNTMEVIDFRLREPNTNELKKMDNMRSEYDPMEYEGDDDEFADDDEKPENGDVKEEASS